MAFDQHRNFSYSTVAVAPVPALAGLSLTVAAGQGSLFTAPCNVTVWAASASPLSTNAEICRVTAVLGDVLTIVRAQEGTAARSIVVGDQIANTTSVKVFTDIENAMIQGISAVGGVATASQVVFSNSNGVSFGVNAQTITASVQTNYLTTAMESDAGSRFVNTSAALNLTNISATFNSNAISLSVAAAAGQSTQPVAASASNGSFLFSTVAFSNANGVTFGTSAGSIISASVATNYLTTAMASDAGSRFVNTSAGLNLTNISATFNSNSISLSVAAAAGQSTQPVAASASNGSFLFSTLGFSNANNVTFGTSAGSIITASVASNAGQSVQPVAASASNGSFLFSTVGFSDANGVTFGTSAGSIITASVAAIPGQSVQPVAASASNGSFLFSTVAFSNANNVTFGTSAGSIITASVADSVAPAMISSFEPYQLGTAAVGVVLPGNSISSVVGFLLPVNLTAAFIRIPVSMQASSTSRAATASSLSASVQMNTTWNAVVYKMNTGASSASLTWVASGHADFTAINSVSIAANGSQGSYSQTWSGWAEGVVTSLSTQYSVSNTNSYQFSSGTVQTAFSGSRWLDINFANSLSAGYYWLVVGLSTSSLTNSTGISAASVANVSFSRWFVNNLTNVPFKVMGSTDNATVQFAAGSFSTVGGGTTAAFPLSNISTAASNPQLYFQMIKR